MVRVAALALVIVASRADAQTSPCNGGVPVYDCAVAQVERQQFAEAIASLQQLLQAQPRDLKALNLLGIALTSAGRADEGSAQFRRAIAIDASFFPAIKNLAINDFNAGRLSDARPRFEAVLAHAPADEVSHLYLAEIEMRQPGRAAAALAHYEQSGARRLQSSEWILHYATCLVDASVNRRDDAVAALERLAPDDAQARFDAGVLLGRAGAHVEAARFFASARTAGYKDGYAAVYNQTLMLVEAQRYDEAIGVGSAFVAAAADGAASSVRNAATAVPAEFYNLLSRAYAGAGRIQEAYDALRTATRIEPAAEDNYLDLATLCLDHKNYDLGLEILDIGLRQRPTSSRLQMQRGVLLVMKGMIAEGEQAFEAARRLSPDDATPYVALAMAWMQTGRTPQAVDTLRTRARTGKPDPVIAYALGIALLRAGATPDDVSGAEAAEAFATAVRLKPEFPQAQAELGKLLLKRGDVAGAIDHLERAVTLDPDRPGPAYVLAQAYRKQGNVERARTLLARVSTLNTLERGDDPDADLKRVVLRIVREPSPAATRSMP